MLNLNIMIMNFLKRFINLVPITILVTVLIFPFIAFSQIGTAKPTIKIQPETLETSKFNKGDTFNQTFTFSGTFPNGSKPQWDVQSKPPGLTAKVESEAGNLVVSGTLTTIGTFSLRVVISDNNGTAGAKTYPITVVSASEPIPPTTTPTDNGADPKGNGAAPGTKPPANNPSGGGSSNNSGEFYNPLGGVNTIPALIVKATKIILALTGMLAVLFIIIGGLRYITSGGSPEAVKSAKNTVTYAIIGLVIAVMAFAIVNVVTNLLINK